MRAAFTRAYGSSPFVRVLPSDRAPSVTGVAGTNDAEIHVSVKGRRRARSSCAIDNLGKGAAGQAMQNINLMLGFPEESALDDSRRRCLTNCTSDNGAQTRLIELRGGLGAVPGVKLAGVHAGIKKRKPDLALVTFAKPMGCASVITTNEIKAAPLLVSEQHIALERRGDARDRLQFRLRERLYGRARRTRRARRPRGRPRRCSASSRPR